MQAVFRPARVVIAGGLARLMLGELVMKRLVIIYSEEDYACACERLEELRTRPDCRAKEEELDAIHDAMLAWELRQDD